MRGTAVTALSSTGVMPVVSNVAPAGISVVVSVFASVVPVYTATRLASMPLSVVRYSLAFTARSAAYFCISAICFFVACFGITLLLLPTMASFASEALCSFSATSSRQALASLSTRVGRRVSRSKFKLHSADVVGAGGGGGAVIDTVVCPEAVWPLSSTTLHVTVIVPGAAPAVDKVAVAPLPLTEPAVEL